MRIELERDADGGAVSLTFTGGLSSNERLERVDDLPEGWRYLHADDLNSSELAAGSEECSPGGRHPVWFLHSVWFLVRDLGLTMTVDRTTISRLRIAVSLGVGLATFGCQSVKEFIGIQLFYDQAPPAARLIEELPYRDNDPRHLLDLHLPQGAGWPTLVFVHGGGWTDGDKDMVVAGADVYGNVGRFFAERGYAVALVNYRLQPEVSWREQVADVADAIQWLHRHVDEYGGDPGAIFVSGHSAGAQLAARAVVDDALMGEARRAVCGVIPISGGAYDLRDPETWKLGADREYHEERLRAGDPTDAWLTEASTVPLVDADDPPFLLLYSQREWESLGHQNRLLAEAIDDVGGTAEVIGVSGQNHARMVLAMSRPRTPVSTAILEFLRRTDCPRD